ncbi:MAG: hypothetical protein IKO65_04580, partial [Victivallales bacterium]|nr:hypothetical protein [Victivallales bacterium]
MKNIFAFRRLTFETASAMHAGSGESDPTQDMPIQLDTNDLPTINATSIAGVLRHLYPDQKEADTLFGHAKGRNIAGSCLIVTDAIVLDEQERPVDGMRTTKLSNYLEQLKRLTLRDHCALGDTGSAKLRGKFDRTVLMAGVRFVVELTVLAEDVATARQQADTLVQLFASPEFRLGGGTRNGFGQIKLLKVIGREYDLAVHEQRAAYLQRSACLADEPANEPELPLPKGKPLAGETRRYRMTPEKFWLVSDGTGFWDLDIRPKLEAYVDWTGDKRPEVKDRVLLPATSIKGALAHRTAYHYNLLKKRYADEISPEEFEEPNAAVKALFGYANDSDGSGQIGRVILSDLYMQAPDSQIFNHVMIDRFTGGAMEGVLFTEQVIAGGEFDFEVTILPPAEDNEPPEYLQAFEAALADLGKGWLP